MRILVVTSCTGEKLHSPENQLTQADFALLPDQSVFAAREATLAAYRTSAEEIYTGQQHVRMMRGVRAAHEQLGADAVDLYVLSAGYGLIPGDRPIVPYECTFQGMKSKELRSWADHLGVPTAIRTLLAQPYDLALLLLGDSYMAACALDASVKLGSPTVAFSGSTMAGKLPDLPNLRTVVLTNQEAKRFSIGLVALKGEVTARLLRTLAANSDALVTLLDPDTNILRVAEQNTDAPVQHSRTGIAPARAAKPTAPPTTRPTARANPTVDYVVQIPTSWWEKPHRQKLRYFIPEWDDLVDRDFDFVTDTHSGGQGDWSNEVYAYQLYPEPYSDGILISKVVAEKSKKKAERINAMGVHRYLRLPRTYPIMGDCGAFGYIKEEVPPYSTAEILDYYTRLDFDYGVSIDHLIVAATGQQRQFRYELTIHNAEEFLREHQKLGLTWTPIGAVQGWDPESYANAARQYADMGYSYIGLGGLVRTNTREILRICEAVHAVIPDSMGVHLFGIARLDALTDFARLGVKSVDSASFMRRAWMGTGENYLSADGVWYAAIRIPEAGASFRAKRMVSEGRAIVDAVERLERTCMQAMLDFDAGILGVEATLDILAEYDHLITPDRPDTRELMRHTLEAAPWKTCPCDICRRDGVQVVIFRGNNRNRRRGFHNTFVFYRLLQRALAGEEIKVRKSRHSGSDALQPTLFDAAEGID
jgi:hypothetical protein